MINTDKTSEKNTSLSISIVDEKRAKIEMEGTEEEIIYMFASAIAGDGKLREIIEISYRLVGEFIEHLEKKKKDQKPQEQESPEIKEFIDQALQKKGTIVN